MRARPSEMPVAGGGMGGGVDEFLFFEDMRPGTSLLAARVSLALISAVSSSVHATHVRLSCNAECWLPLASS